MAENEVENFKDIPEKNLAYTQDFKDLLHEQNLENPHILKKVIERIDSLSDVGDTTTEGNIKIEFIKRNKDRNFYMVSVATKDGAEEFFVKRAPTYTNEKEKREFELGYEEFLGSVAVKEKLKNLPYVEMVEYKLGFRNEEYTYFVSRFDELLTKKLYVYINNLEERYSENPELFMGEGLEAQALRSKVLEIQGVLGQGFVGKDITDVNMAYDQKTGKIILFDLSLPEEENTK